jgi:hypothetical protein
MTRCLNCGAERAEEVCEACGLGPSAAEFSLRKRLLNRTAIFLLGSLAFVVASERYPSLELDRILIFIGLLFFLTLGLAIWVERRALKHGEVEALKRIYYGLIPVPWILSVVLLANGAFDHRAPQIIREQVVSKFSMPGPVASRRLIVTSWREGHRIERIAVTRQDFDGFDRGDFVDIQLKDGFLGIPWVSGVSHP